MANVLTVPASGAIIFDNQTAGSSTISPLSSAPRLQYDNAGGLNITSYTTGASAIDRFSVDGANGRLFSVSDSLTGVIFSVNDAAGLPIIEVNSTTTDVVNIGTYGTNALVVGGSNVGIGTATPTEKLTVSGNISASGTLSANQLSITGDATAKAASRTALGLGTGDTLQIAGLTMGTLGSLDPIIVKANNAGTFLTKLYGFNQNFFTFGYFGGRTVPGATTSSNGVYAWSNSTTSADTTVDLLLHRDAANTLAQRNGTAQQESRIYGTYANSGADYRRLALKMSTAGVAQIVAEGAGTGASGNRIEIDGLRIGKGGGDVATNTALGASALNSNTTGGFNSAVGNSALSNNTTGGSNSAVGRVALGFNTTGSSNSAVGRAALYSNTTGSSNSAVGFDAGRYIADGTTSNAITTNSVYLGADTKALASNQTNQIVIGYNAIGLGSNTAVLGNDSIVTTALKGDVGIGTTSPASKLTVTGGDIEVTDSASGIILKSPDGTRYRITVTNGGALSSTDLTPPAPTTPPPLTTTPAP